MSSEFKDSLPSRQAAWERLVGKWVSRVDEIGSTSIGKDWCEDRIEFTVGRQWIRTILRPGLLRSGIERKMSFSEIAEVDEDGDEIVLTLGSSSNPLIRPIVKLVVRLPEADCLVDERGTMYRRVEQFRDWSVRLHRPWTFSPK